MRILFKLLALGLTVLLGLQGNAQNLDDNQEEYGIKKGRYYSALTFSLDQRKAENEDQLLRQVVNQDRLNYRIVGNGGYAIKDNFTIGLSLGYGRQKEDITFLDENDQEITSKRLQEGLSIAPNIRQYIPIGKGKLQIIVQTELGFTFGESLERIFRVDDIDKINGDFFEFNLGVSPGVALFFTRNWAFETTVNIAGLKTRVEEEVLNNNEANKQRVETTSIDLQLNLLALNLGVAYYF
ncbi:outer membrane beta-barrel protein [Winogradskyella sp. DF17]|uniref:Outer membrane beta-barrel protein n=1 Tax=Winogradskyella pelagia TaxID=2819984 RepID=A0ABS3T0W5_9FLAO|nr:outer membrane beta-barrel protein [Winogradskyella sp. DF17]MBO3116378.1 outer membrane beta-barrel protein [Winogradskyella sp. DF17]